MSDIQETAVTEAETPVEKAIPAKEDLLQTRRTQKVGTVVSDKMDKTVVVAVEDRFKHPLYGKVLRQTARLKAHDEQNECGTGDRVLIMETRPLSATKRWRVVQVLERAK